MNSTSSCISSRTGAESFLWTLLIKSLTVFMFSVELSCILKSLARTILVPSSKKQSKITPITDSGFMYQSITGIPEDKSTYIIMAVIRNEFYTGAVLKIPYTARIAVF